MRWSVSIEAEGDREMSREEIVDLADAIAGLDGIATGIGTNHYGAQIVVAADDEESAVEEATKEFRAAATKACLPDFPVTRVEAVSEEDS